MQMEFHMTFRIIIFETKLTGGTESSATKSWLASSSQAPAFNDQKPTLSPRNPSMDSAYCCTWSHAMMCSPNPIFIVLIV